jgi:hypothetical protein
MQGSLAKIKVIQACAAQIEEYTKKEKSQKKILKGGFILAINTLNKITKKRRKEANKVL